MASVHNDTVNSPGALWEQVRAQADEFRAAGYNAIPMKPNGKKEPARKWAPYKSERIPDEEHDKWFWGNYKWQGIAVLTGVAFDGALPIELFEFENEAIAKEYKKAADAAGLGGLLHRIQEGYLDLAPRGGYHLLWRCEEVGPSQVLAGDPEANPDHPVLIETRGRSNSEGKGLAIVAPSGGGVHPEGRPWKRTRGNVSTIVAVTLEERAALLALARTFDRRPPKETTNGSRPGDVYNLEGPPIEELIEPAGWTLARTDGDVTYWTRPGKDPADGVSASLGLVRDGDGNPLLHVFTSSAEPFKMDQNYGKFAVYVMTQHGGDYKAAAKALAAEGYGAKTKGESGDGGPTQAQILLGIVEERWELTWWDEGDGEPFAIELGGPNLAYPLRGSDSFRGALQNAFYEQEGKPASNEALSQVMLILEHRARRSEPRRLWIRVAQPERGVIYVDMGDTSGRCVEITTAGWEILDRSPVTFRRTKATRPLPEPDRGGGLEKLWHFTRFKEEYRPLVKAWCVHAYFPDEDHAILRVTGPWDAGKTQICKRLAATLDPAIATFRGWGRTRDIRDWVTHVTASWVSGLDNISWIDPELDDALCRSSTGDAVRDRKYFTQGDVDIRAFRRVVIFNDISLGLIKGDLVDRLLEAGIPRLDDKDAIPDEELNADWEDAYPGIVGGLFNFIVKVLKELPNVERPSEGWPRPRGFSRVLEAVDLADKSNGMATWREMKDRLKANVAEGDLVALCMLELLRSKAEMEGSCTDWLKWLANAYRGLTGKDYPPTDKLVWPQNERALSAWLKRLESAIPAMGVSLTEKPRPNNMERTKWEAKWLTGSPPVREGEPF